MPKFPMNNTTFSSSFLGGKGSLKFQSDQDVWQTLVDGNKEFTPDVDTLAELNVDLAAGSSLKFGEASANELKLDLDASLETVGSARLIWDADDEIIKSYGVKDLFSPAHYFALLTLRSKADATVNGAVSLFGGPLKGTFGIGAGANVGYERLVRFRRIQKAGDVLKEILSGVRLPHSVVTKLPEEGEVIAFRYGGYLNLSAGLAWGYSLSGTRNIELSNLQLSLDYALRVMAAASFSYRLAGDFSIEARRGSVANWARIVVKKSKESSQKFAFDFGFTAAAELKGVPETPEKLLEALLEIDTESFIKVLNELKSVSTVEGIKAKLNDLAEDFVASRARKWLGDALDASNIGEFLEIVNRIVETYKNIDKRIIHLYEDFLGDTDGLIGMLDKIAGIPDRLGLGVLNKAADKAVWDLIRRIAGDRFYSVLLDDQEFDSFSGFVREIRKFLTDGVSKEIRDFIKEIKDDYNLETVFTALGAVDTVPKVKNLADKKLKGLIEKIIGESVDGNSEVLDRILKPLQAFFKNLQKFKTTYAEQVEKAVKQSFAFNLNYAYNTAKKGEKIIDVEVDISNAQGLSLADAALNGDFTELLQQFDPTVVRLHKALFKEELTKSAELKINIFNYNKRGIVRLVQQSEHSVESTADGLLNLYSVDTNQETLDEKGWRKNKESVKTNFALKIVGSSLQPTGTVVNAEVVQGLKQISAQYTAMYEDSKTKIRELRQYLGLGAVLNLVSPNDVVNSLVAKLGKTGEKDTLGKVKIEYVAKYSDEAIREALTSPLPSGFQELLRQVIREITAAPYMSKPITDGQCLMRLAYLSPSVFQHYLSNSKSLSGLSITVKAPDWHRSSPAQVQLNQTEKTLLEFFYRREESIVKRFPKLIGVLGKFPNVEFDDLQAEARNFVSLSNDLLVNNADNPFFALFDWFVRGKSSTSSQRKSALVLSFETTLSDGSPFETTMYFTA